MVPPSSDRRNQPLTKAPLANAAEEEVQASGPPRPKSLTETAGGGKGGSAHSRDAAAKSNQFRRNQGGNAEKYPAVDAPVCL